MVCAPRLQRDGGLEAPSSNGNTRGTDLKWWVSWSGKSPCYILFIYMSVCKSPGWILRRTILYLVIRYSCLIFSGICDPTFCMNHLNRVQTKVRVTEGPLRNFTLSIFSENMRKWFEHALNIHSTYLRQKAGDLNLRCPPIFNVTVCDVCVRNTNGPTSP